MYCSAAIVESERRGPVTATVLPGNSLPLPGEAITCVTEGAVVSICAACWKAAQR